MIVNALAKKAFFLSAVLRSLTYVTRVQHVEDNAADLKPKNEKSTKHLGIMNGIVTDPAVHPYMVAWVNKLEDIVLTAAHCWGEGVTINLRAGVHDLFDKNDDYEEFIVGPTDQYVHELYDPTLGHKNGFMIAKLPSSSSYKWVTLNTDPDEPSDGKIFHVMEWGTIEFRGFASDDLQYADVLYKSNAVCKEKYEGHEIPIEMMCAADVVEGQDS
eukprot:7308247-Ditylum_brightwellii.AAC.1